MNTTLAPLKVLVIDDHRSYAEALSLAVSLEPDLESLGHAPDVATALERVHEEHPDVVVIDWQLPEIDGIEGVRRILVADPKVKLVMITGHSERGLERLAGMAGAVAFLPKEASIAEIMQQVRAAAAGESVIDVSDEDDDRPRRPNLTPREIEVLYMLARGRDPQAIATELFLSVHTIRGYVKEVLRKLGAHSQLEAVAIARRTGLLPGAEY